MDHNRVSYFPESIRNEIALPDKFTFPFYYEPHPLARLAAASLQQYLETHTGLDHNFGLTPGSMLPVIGKMFGVLVIRDKEERTGYLWGFSGKLAGSNDHPGFVPPVFDMLSESSFFLTEQEIIDTINRQLESLETDSGYLELKLEIARFSVQSADELASLRQTLKKKKEQRDKEREEQKEILTPAEYVLLEAALVKQSLYDKHRLRKLRERWALLLEEKRAALAAGEQRIETLKAERRDRSAALQTRLFDQYTFLNTQGKKKSLGDIFSGTAFGKPPAGAGECATPKLLQYAFMNGYTPVAMAEFWWGASPKSEIRRHRQFYPACTGKCKPILEHMLEGIPMDENPLLLVPQGERNIETVYEDEYLIVVNKPSGLRSVPGIEITDSVYTRLKQAWIHTEPLIVHRLDMDTSGLLVVAKTKDAHRHLQKQFLRRTVRKRYTALLSDIVEGNEGTIRLPLRADLFNRPRQLVCFDSGKKSITDWKVVGRTGKETRIHFWPLTGRTHQLRMHASHELGLNAPIVGDDLYGTADRRLCLHAAHLSFVHPKTKKELSFEVKEDF